MQERYADVIVDISSEKLDRVFQYRIPERMEGMLEPGTVVEVPFGKGNRPVRGYVTGISGQAGYDPARMKEIGRVMTDAADEEARLVGLAAWIRNRYGSTMLQALKTVIPVKRKIKEKQRRWIVLALDGDAARERLDFFQRKHQKARARLVEALLDEPELPWELVSEKLNITAAVIRALQEQGIVRVKSEKLYRNPVQGYTGEKKEIRLNEEQQRIVDEITGEWEEDPPGRYLIHGITGSGKTEVYMELIRYAVSRGQQAIVLIPEIALTYQTVLRFYRNFGDRVSVINSRLSQGERYDQFERARNGELDVMIGPRSALFTPFSRLGIIVMDEEHEPAYQSETMPRYHAREVALQRGKMEHARVVLGSATPFSGSLLRRHDREIQIVPPDQAGRPGRTSQCVGGGSAAGTAGREPFHAQPQPAGGHRRTPVIRGTGDALFKQERIRRIRFLPFLRTCTDLPSLRRIPVSPQRRKAGLPLLRL